MSGLSRAPIDLEGILTLTEPCSSENCESNAIMRILYVPGRDKFSLELSFSSNLNLDHHERTPFFPQIGFTFKSKFGKSFKSIFSQIFYITKTLKEYIISLSTLFRFTEIGS